MTKSPWTATAELQFPHSRSDGNGGIEMTLHTVKNLSLRMAVEEACIQRQGDGFNLMRICLADGTANWLGPQIAELAKQLDNKGS